MHDFIIGWLSEVLEDLNGHVLSVDVNVIGCADWHDDVEDPSYDQITLPVRDLIKQEVAV